jgi:hypothetical protein
MKFGGGSMRHCRNETVAAGEAVPAPAGVKNL